MCRKSKNTSFDKRQLVVYHHAIGKSGDKIAHLLNMPRSTVYDIIKRFQKEDRIDFKKPPGRPYKLSEQDKRFIGRSVAKNPKISAPKIATELNSRCKVKVSSQTIRRVIKSTGCNSRTARRKPLISKVNRKKRLEFAKKYLYVDENFWSDVIFSDESKYNIFGSDGKQRVWRKPNTELELRNLNLSVKHGGGSVMVWGCFSANGVGSLVFIDEIMNAKLYIDILKKNLRQNAAKLGIINSFKFYQDNDPKHTAYNSKSWLLYNCPKVLDTPPQSPDCNPIENLWDYLEDRVRETPILNKEHLKKRLQEEWCKIPLDYIRNLIFSMPRRLEAIIKAKGMHTKY